MGEHKGYMHYTIGKRKGFTVKGAHDPHFVLEIKPETNQIVVGKKEELEVLHVELDNINMFDDRVEFDTTIKVRYRTKSIPCHVKIENDKA